jgi:hypothetical protein
LNLGEPGVNLTPAHDFRKTGAAIPPAAEQKTGAEPKIFRVDQTAQGPV